MNLIFMFPAVACLCVAVVQAMRCRWKNMTIALLAGLVFLQFTGFVLQSHANANLRAWNQALKTKVTGLEDKLKEMGSNQAAQATAPNVADPGR